MECTKQTQSLSLRWTSEDAVTSHAFTAAG